jgi:tetratricopeptide (TPR) repeat protein
LLLRIQTGWLGRTVMQAARAFKLPARPERPAVMPSGSLAQAAEPPPQAPLVANAVALGNTHYNEAVALFEKDKRNVVPAIQLLEKARAFHDAPQISIKLAEMQLFAHRPQDASATYLKAFHAHPENRDIWYYAGIHLLRHGEAEDVLDLYGSILKMDPDYPLARFFTKLYEDFPEYVRTLTESIRAADGKSGAQGKRKHVIGFAIWGRRYVEVFLKYTLSALLAPGNLPNLAALRDVHLVIFTTRNDAAALESSEIYRAAANFCNFHLIFYDPLLVEISRARNWPIKCHAQFGLMSGAHYAILECARRLDLDASLLGGDNIVNDAFLSNLAKILDGDVSAVGCAGFRVPTDKAFDLIDRRYRSADGTISIPSNEFSRLLMECLPEAFFVDSKNFTRFPLFLCWRVGKEGMLVHANHYHPYAIRGSYLREIKTPCIDPIDGMFILRYLTDINKMHLVSNSDITVVDAGENPLVVAPHLIGPNTFAVEDVGLWLWMYYDRLRSNYFMNCIRFEFGNVTSKQLLQSEKTAKKTVADILEHTETLEQQNHALKSWRL